MARRKRREFTAAQKREIVARSKNADGKICCEGCGQVLGGKKHEIDHIIPEGDRPDVDKQRKLTIAEGQLLGMACCHRGPDGKTAKDQKNIAKGNRRIDKHDGIKKPKSTIKSAPMAKAEKQPKPAGKASLPPRRLFTRE